MIRSSVVGALTFAALTVTAASATAQTRVQAGILQCRGAPTASFIVGSVHELGCVFQSDRGPRYRYYGVVRRVGLDIGFTEQSAPAWAVFAPTHRIGPGELSGNYGGGTAGAAIGIGGNASGSLQKKGSTSQQVKREALFQQFLDWQKNQPVEHRPR